MQYPEAIGRLIESFTKLPGIGPKTAIRLAFHVLDMEEDDVLTFAKSLVSAKRDIKYCTVCGISRMSIHVRYVQTPIVIQR